MKQINVLPKIKVKSSRVKGISFHSKRPIIIVGLHCGLLELWDYSIHVLIAKFEGHKGPVRSVNFHEDQPLFVSGGDDTLVRVWNYKLRKCLFELRGHVDYIRSTVFHHLQPWIASASDDMTIRIWNWQSRTCMGILTGHVHYVMCAQFHPFMDFVISGSLDCTMKVWDISSLHTKNLTTPGNKANEILRENNFPELFGDHPILSTATLEKHDRGINWIAIHPVSGMIATCGDDKYIKLVRMTRSADLIESGTLRGHTSNVSSLLFHPREDYVISNSEDGSIRIWNLNTKRCETRYKHDGRFWALNCHKYLNLFAAGHDYGFFVFKIGKERPVSCLTENSLFWLVKNTLIEFEFSKCVESSLTEIKRGIVTSISNNQSEGMMLVFYLKNDVSDSPSYVLVNVTKSSKPAITGGGVAGFWLSRNRFLVLDSNQAIFVKNLKNEITQKISIPGCLRVFQALSGQFLCATEEKVMLYDMQMKRVVSSVSVNKARRVVWSNNHVAIIAGKVLVICGSKLENLFTINDSFQIKSGVWGENEVFLYSTTHHIKYCLINGDSGIVRTIDMPLYLMRMEDNMIYVLDREARLNRLVIDNSEYVFKLAIVNREFDKVINIIRNSKMIGKSIVIYLEKKGFPQLAMHFVSDDATKFRLAIQCGDLESAHTAALNLNKNEFWENLGTSAMMQGNIQIAERAYQVVKDYNKLCLLYVITGNLEKLSKMLKIAQHRGDSNMHAQISLFMGSVEERIRVLLLSNQNTLAYLTASCHGLGSVADEIAQSFGKTPPFDESASLMMPAAPLIVVASNWPQYATDRVLGDALIKSTVVEQTEVNVTAWGDDTNLDFDDKFVPVDDVSDEEKGWDVDDLDITPELEDEIPDVVESDLVEGLAPSSTWTINSKNPLDYILAGEFESAIHILRGRYSVVNFSPYESIFMRIYTQSRTCLPGIPSTPCIFAYPQADNIEVGGKSGSSLYTITVEELKNSLPSAYDMTSKGNFAKALDVFRGILLRSTLIGDSSSGKNLSEFKELINSCREYILGLSIELHRKKLPKESLSDQKRQCELALYFANCNLQLSHQILTLRTALNLTYRLKNYKTAINVANRLIKLGPPADVANQARKIITACNKDPVDSVSIDYDYLNPFEICGASYKPIYQGSPCVRDPLTRTAYLPEYCGQVCRISLVTEIRKSE